VAHTGATPVFADIDLATYNLDPASVAKAISRRTKAVLLVHQVGLPADVAAFRRLARARRVTLIEDAACAIGSRLDGKPVGGDAEVAVFSFHPRKLVTTGEGGAVTTSDDDLAERVRSLRHHGWSPSDGYTDLPAPAFNYRLSDVLAAVGIPQLRRLDELYASYDRVARGYAERLAHLDVVLPRADDGDRHGWQAYVIQLDRRDEVMAALREQGIQCQIGTYALHRLGAYRGQGSFPGADAAFERALALPLHAQLSDAELDRVAEALDKIVSHH
jgi:perosamine synthetase